MAVDVNGGHWGSRGIRSGVAGNGARGGVGGGGAAPTVLQPSGQAHCLRQQARADARLEALLQPAGEHRGRELCVSSTEAPIVVSVGPKYLCGRQKG